MSAKPCDACHGFRLKPEALAVKIDGQHIGEVSLLSVRAAIDWAEGLPQKLDAKRNEIAHRILKEIVDRLAFLRDVGLDYLTLARASGTLSGGESQRIRLASQIGSGLTGVLYVLDEPSIGLHQRDNARLLDTLQAVARPRQHGDRRRARRGCDLGRRLRGRRRSGRRRAWRRDRRQGDAAGNRRQSEFADRALSLRRADGGDPARAPRADAGPGADNRRRARQQPEECHGEHSARACSPASPASRAAANRRWSSTRSTRPRRAPSERRERPAGAARAHRRPRGDRQGDRHRPVADRPHAALQSRHLYRRLHPDPRLVRRPAGGQGARLSAGALLVQRQGRAVRGLPGRRRHQDRDALSARRLRHLRRVQGQALRPRDARGALPATSRSPTCST